MSHRVTFAIHISLTNHIGVDSGIGVSYHYYYYYYNSICLIYYYDYQLDSKAGQLTNMDIQYMI